ncbi:life-span regulatory factor [Fusarium heterosporum]|uniref:Life-span regulatory factor n=1 Tax=Fusarium heterosporum TaxID=42747 RepID=A0A8H5T4Y6_FUSHE|nr:life-span regulatory factor [Fusarium heterosporum]
MGIPIINHHTPSKVARYSAEQPQEDLVFVAEEENVFPYFCMTCEKEFTPRDHQLLYCSESCRKFDHETYPKVTRSTCYTSKCVANLPFYSASVPAPKDIVPRASPTRTAIGFPMATGDLRGAANNGAVDTTCCRSASAALNVAPRTGYA